VNRENKIPLKRQKKTQKNLSPKITILWEMITVYQLDQQVIKMAKSRKIRTHI